MQATDTDEGKPDAEERGKMLSYYLIDEGRKVQKMGRAVWHVGVRAIAKSLENGNKFEFANEMICFALASEIGLPVARGEMAFRGKERTYCSFHGVAIARESLPPKVDPKQVVAANNSLACGIFLFDMWVLNRDRHEKNIAHNSETKATVIFDHGDALMKTPDPETHLQSYQNQFAVENHCLMKELTSVSPFMHWYWKIHQLTTQRIRDIVSGVGSLGISPTLVDCVTETLVQRRVILLDLVCDNLFLFKGLGLFSDDNSQELKTLQSFLRGYPSDIQDMVDGRV